MHVDAIAAPLPPIPTVNPSKNATRPIHLWQDLFLSVREQVQQHAIRLHVTCTLRISVLQSPSKIRAGPPSARGVGRVLMVS